MHAKKLAILQSNYIPWKGYFDIIAAVDEFIIYDDVQFTKNDWRNRNKIKTASGFDWISIPVGKNIKRKICEVIIPNNGWQSRHWKALELSYSNAPHFLEITEFLKPLYLDNQYETLTELNVSFINAICNFLNIKTKISHSWEYGGAGGRSERLIDICLKAGATEYISGPSAKNYLDETFFLKNNINISWFDYCDYPVYPQLWGNYQNEVTILDLLFNCGRDSYKYMKNAPILGSIK